MTGLYDNLTSGDIEGLRAANAQLPSGYQVVPGRSFVGVEVAGYDHARHYAGDGWKFHLSVAPEDLPRATEIVMGLVEKHGVQAFKVTTPQTALNFDNPSNPQAGKQFTLYGARGDGSFRWDNVIRDIELNFAEADIRPSASNIQGDRMVPGSRYAGYRNELAHGQLGEYSDSDGYLGADEIRQAVRAGRAQAGWEHNPTRQPDSLQDIDFSRDPEIAQARAQRLVAAAPEVAASQLAAAQPERSSGSRTSNAAYSVRADLREALGKNNVIGVERVEGGYRVEVPPTYSRSELSRAGIDPTGLRRTAPEQGNHFIAVPDERLPASMARDANVFGALDRAGISDIASNAYRTGENGQITGYVIEVPETYSRSNLAAAGIDVSRIPNSAREAIGNGLHRITIPLDATAGVGVVDPQQQPPMPEEQRAALEEMRNRLRAQGPGRTPRDMLGMGERDLHAPLRPITPAVTDAPAPLHATVAEPSHPPRTAAPAPANSTPAPHAPVATNAGDVHPTHTAAAAGAAAAFGAGAGETVGHGGHGGDAHARSVHGVSTGVGAALGVYGMSQKVGRDGTLQSDLKAGGAQAGLAVVSTVGDATAIAADSVGLLRGNGAVGAVARRAALPVAVVAGALETGTAIAARDGHRAANAAGATAGGILGGMAAGAATGLVLGSVVPGAGNVVGAVVGGAAGLVGGLVGAYYGGQAAGAVAGAALDNRLNADIDNPLNAMAGQLQRAGYAKMLDKDGDGKIEAHEVRQFVGADGVRDLRAAAKNGLTGAEVSNEIKQQLTENYSHEIKNLIEEAKQKGFTKRLDANQDGKFDITDVKENLKKTGMTLDANTDGHITGGEFIRAQTTPAKPAQASGAGHGHR